jgi:hypothetical protein
VPGHVRIKLHFDDGLHDKNGNKKSECSAI